MPEVTYYARALNTYPPLEGTSAATVVGGDTALTTSDGDTSHVSLKSITPSEAEPDLYLETLTFHWVPETAVPAGAVGQSALFGGDLRQGPDAELGGVGVAGLTVRDTTGTVGGTLINNSDTYSVVDLPVTFERSWGPAYEHLMDAITTGQPFDAQPGIAGLPGSVMHVLVTMLRVHVVYDAPTVAPHLIFNRTDGLGAGAAFVFNRDTRQSSGLVFGNT